MKYAATTAPAPTDIRAKNAKLAAPARKRKKKKKKKWSKACQDKMKEYWAGYCEEKGIFHKHMHMIKRIVVPAAMPPIAPPDRLLSEGGAGELEANGHGHGPPLGNPHADTFAALTKSNGAEQLPHTRDTLPAHVPPHTTSTPYISTVTS